MTWLEVYLYWLFLLKLFELYFWVSYHVHPTEMSEHNLYQADRFFSVFLACLMLYLFHPFVSKPIYIDHETRDYLFTFATLSLIYLVPRPSLTSATNLIRLHIQ